MKKRLLALLLVLVLLIPAGVASAATRYRVNTSSVKVRQMPSESAAVLASYRLDYVLTVQSSKNGWSYVKFTTGKEGYVQTKYIKKATTGSAWITNDDTSMRTGPSGDFIAVAKLARGRKVSVLSWGSKYSYVSAGDLGTGYVVNDLLSKKKVAASGNASETTAVTGGNYDAWVLNAGYRKVNLRSQPNSKAPIMASYPTGTKVRVLAHSATWDKIQVDGNTGYMMTKFLSTSAPAPTEVPVETDPPAANYTAYVVSSNGKPVNMRKGAGNYSVIDKVPYGSAVTVLNHDTKWDKISYGGKVGYMETRFLQLSLPAGIPEGGATPTPEPTAKPAFQPYLATITSPNGKGVNVHYKPDKGSSNVNGMGNNGRLEVGTTVTVIGLTGYWAEVEYGGKTGFVMQEFLN
ncbi:MAG: SH3 domain-containing protein [Clostridia bacterium]